MVRRLARCRPPLPSTLALRRPSACRRTGRTSPSCRALPSTARPCQARLPSGAYHAESQHVCLPSRALTLLLTTCNAQTSRACGVGRGAHGQRLQRPNICSPNSGGRVSVHLNPPPPPPHTTHTRTSPAKALVTCLSPASIRRAHTHNALSTRTTNPENRWDSQPSAGVVVPGSSDHPPRIHPRPSGSGAQDILRALYRDDLR